MQINSALEGASLPLPRLELATLHRDDRGGKGFAGAPLSRRARARLLHHLVNLLERQTLGSLLKTVLNVWSVRARDVPLSRGQGNMSTQTRTCKDRPR
jgi:hypothetical protein